MGHIKLNFRLSEEDLKVVYRKRLNAALENCSSIYLDTPSEIRVMKMGYNKALEIIELYEAEANKFKQLAAPIDTDAELTDADEQDDNEADDEPLYRDNHTD